MHDKVTLQLCTLLTLILLGLKDPSTRRFNLRSIYIGNVVVSGLLLALLLSNLTVYAWRMIQAKIRGKIWCAPDGSQLCINTCQYSVVWICAFLLLMSC